MSYSTKFKSIVLVVLTKKKKKNKKHGARYYYISATWQFRTPQFFEIRSSQIFFAEIEPTI